jgi:hypothetical protein
VLLFATVTAGQGLAFLAACRQLALVGVCVAATLLHAVLLAYIEAVCCDCMTAVRLVLGLLVRVCDRPASQALMIYCMSYSFSKLVCFHPVAAAAAMLL